MLATFLSLMPDAAVAVGANGTIVAMNARTEVFFGYKSEELEGRPIEILVPERFRHAHRSDRAGYSAAPHARPMGAGLDLYARRKDGTEFPVDISLAPIGDADTPLVVAAVRDITERKEAQAAEAQLAAIVESSSDGIFSISHRGVITTWNPGAETLFGLGRAAVLGHHISTFFPDDPVLEELLAAAQVSQHSRSQDTRWPTATGELVDVAVSVSALAIGNERGFSVLARDATARKAAEAEVARHARWQAATAEIRLDLLSDGSLESSLTLVCKWAVELMEARSAVLVLYDRPDGRARVAAEAGRPADLSALGGLDELPGLVAGAIAHGSTETGRLDLLPQLQALAYPIAFPGASQRTGALLITADEGRGGPPGQEEILQSLAASALLAFELSAVRSERDRLLISADRERIARDLHDLVIQRLFGAGLRLQGALSLIDSEPAAARVTSTVNDLDTTIKEIREAIFALESAPGAGLQAKVKETASSAAEALGFNPSIAFRGQPTRDISLQVQIEATAVVREALSNVARHARASEVDVVVTVHDELTISVTDNGVGMGEPERFSGIANARARAELLGGCLQVGPGPDAGTCFEWRVPLAVLGKRT